jgi:hypothetical protein
MTCEATCPFTGYKAHRALMGDGGSGSFCLLIPQAQQVPPLRGAVSHVANYC